MIKNETCCLTFMVVCITPFLHSPFYPRFDVVFVALGSFKSVVGGVIGIEPIFSNSYISGTPKLIRNTL